VHQIQTERAAQGHPTPPKAADLSTATAQEHLQGLLGDDLMRALQDKPLDASLIADLPRRRVA